MIGKPRAARDDRMESALSYGILAATLALMLNVLWPSLLRPGYLTAWDAGGHLLKAHYFAHHLLQRGYLSGWFPLWHGGFDLFQFYPPLLYYLLGLLTLVVEPEFALRLVVAALWLGLLPTTYYFLRSFELDRFPAAIGSAGVLALNNNYGVGLGSLYGLGLLPNGLGILLAIGTLGRLRRDLRDLGRSWRHPAVTGLGFGLLLLAHTFSTYWWAIASVILAVTEASFSGRAPARLSRYGLVLAIGFLISAYWWVPLALGVGHLGQPGTMRPGSRLEIARDLLLARDGGGRFITVFAVGGLAYLAVRRRPRDLLFLGSLAGVSLLLSVNAINRLLPFGSVVGSTQFIRFQAFFAWSWMTLAAFGMAWAWRLCEWIRPPPWRGTALAAAALLLFGLILMPALRSKRWLLGVVQNESTAELAPVADYLRRNLRPGDFILSEFNWGSRFRLGSPHFVNQRLPMVLEGVWDLDGNYPESSQGATRPVYLASVLGIGEFIRTQQVYLASRGIRFIVTTDSTTKHALAKEGWLNLTWDGGTLAVLEVRDFRSRFGLPKELSDRIASVSFRDPGTYRIEFNAPVTIPAGTTLALSHHPWLEVASENGPIASDADADHRLRVSKAARAVRTLTIVYRPPLATSIAKGVSAIGWLGILLAMMTLPTVVGEGLAAKKR